MKRQHVPAAPRIPASGLLLSAVLLTSVFVSAAAAAPIRLGNLPLSVEPGEKLLLLTDAAIQKTFGAANRPDAVFFSSDKKVSMAFEWRDIKLANADVNTMLDKFPAVIRSQVPGVKTMKQQLLSLNGNSWADFVFVAPGKAGDVRREMLITSAQGRMLVLTISSNLADYSRNEADVKAMTDSIRLN